MFNTSVLCALCVHCTTSYSLKFSSKFLLFYFHHLFAAVHLQIFCFLLLFQTMQSPKLLYNGQLYCSGCLTTLSTQPEKVTADVITAPPPRLSSHQLQHKDKSMWRQLFSLHIGPRSQHLGGSPQGNHDRRAVVYRRTRMEWN